MTEKILQLNTEKNIFWTLISILLLCAGFYIYSVTATIHNVVERQNLENKATQLGLTLGGEEYKYIAQRNAVTLSYAYSLGFKDISEKKFIYRNSNFQNTNVVSYVSK